jgi:predicted flap endonuclease-1-like 5' DNA nuclease
MRLDYILYVLAAALFTVTAISAVIIVESERSLWVVTTVVLGILSLSIGYIQRPNAKVSTQPQTTALSIPAPSELMPPETQAIAVPEKLAQTQVDNEPVQPENTEAIQIQVSQPPATQTNELQTMNVQVNRIRSPLKKLKGIGEKRVNQLNAIGINTINDLANASIQEVAKALKISPKIVDKWVAEAKVLVENKTKKKKR